ncbi:MAG: hypothetical protein ABIO04_09185 [Ferruginibacter sp.]
MKKRLLVFLFVGSAALFTSLNGYSQDNSSAAEDVKDAAKKTGKAVEKGAVKTADKTKQVAASTKAIVVDKVYEGKVGPGGHRVYINKNAKYYWIDKKGRKHFIAENQLKDKS